MNQLRVAAVQLNVSKSKEENLRKATEFIREATNRGCKLVVLPGMFVCPYKPSTYPLYAEVGRGLTWRTLSRVAKDNAVYIIGGSIPEMGKDEKVYATTYVFNPLGDEIGKYRKSHLCDIDIKGGQYYKESDTITKGEDSIVFDTEYGKIGIASGYDVRFPTFFKELVDSGAKIIAILSSFNTTTGLDHSELLIRSRALDNQVYTIGVSQARNYESFYISYAKSLIADPWGRIVNRMGIEEGMLIEDIDVDMVDTIRKELPVVEKY